MSIGLGIEAISRGYRVTFVQVDGLIRLLKTEEISRNSRAKVKRMVGSDLVIIDDLMFMATETARGKPLFSNNQQALRPDFHHHYIKQETR